MVRTQLNNLCLMTNKGILFWYILYRINIFTKNYKQFANHKLYYTFPLDQLTELSATLIGPPGPPGPSRPGRPGPPGVQGPSGISISPKV